MCHTSLLSNAAYILVDKLAAPPSQWKIIFFNTRPKMGDKGATKIDDVRDDSEIYTNKKIFFTTFFILLPAKGSPSFKRRFSRQKRMQALAL